MSLPPITDVITDPSLGQIGPAAGGGAVFGWLSDQVAGPILGAIVDLVGNAVLALAGLALVVLGVRRLFAGS